MLSNIGITQLLICLVIVVLIFGTRKLRNAGKDIGEGIRGVRDGFGSKNLEELGDEIGETRRSINVFRKKVASDDSGSEDYRD